MRTDIPNELLYSDDFSSIKEYSHKVTISKFLPVWSSVVDGAEEYSFGHTASINNDKLLHARYASDGNVEYRIIDMTTPNFSATFDKTLTADGSHKWTQDKVPTSIKAVPFNTGWRLFYFNNGSLYATDIAIDGTTSNTKTVYTPTSDSYTYSKVFDAANEQTVFYVQLKASEDSPSSHIKNEIIYNDIIIISEEEGAWAIEDTPLSDYYISSMMVSPFVAKPRFYNTGNNRTIDKNDTGGGNDIITQWGFRPVGGCAAFSNSDGTYTIVISATFWNEWGADTYSHGTRIFTYNPSNSVWGVTKSGFTADYNSNENLSLTYYVKSSDNKLVSFNRISEPTLSVQDNSNVEIPRINEIFVSMLSDNNKYLSMPVFITDDMKLSSPSFCHYGNTIYAISYDNIWNTPACEILGVKQEQDISANVTKWSVTTSNSGKSQASIGINPTFPDDQLTANIDPLSIVRIYVGHTSATTIIFTGYIDSISPSLDSQKYIVNIETSASLLVDTLVTDSYADFLPQETNDEIIPSTDDPSVIKGLITSSGQWRLLRGEGTDVLPNLSAVAWNSYYFNSTYNIPNQSVIALLSIKAAPPRHKTDNDYIIYTYHRGRAGTWYNDIAYVPFQSQTDGYASITTRMGTLKNIIDTSSSPINNNDDFNAYAETHNLPSQSRNIYGVDRNIPTTVSYEMLQPDYSSTQQNPQQTTGIIKDIEYLAGTNQSFRNHPMQYATMSGIVFHVQNEGRKYAFVWEVDTSLDSEGEYTGSHIDDIDTLQDFDKTTYNTHGKNRLYLIVSDYIKDNDENNTLYGAVPSSNTYYNNAIYSSNEEIYSVDASNDLVPGRPADLSVRIAGGKIYCMYRPTPEIGDSPADWILAFNPINVSRFGSGKFGIIGRGLGTIYWKNMSPFIKPLLDATNLPIFWNMQFADGSENISIAEIIKRTAWLAFNKVITTQLSHFSGEIQGTTKILEVNKASKNILFTGNITLPESGSEVGVIIRNKMPDSIDDRVEIIISSNGTSTTSGQPIYSYVTINIYEDGAITYSDKQPIVIDIPINTPIPIKIAARNNIYSVWMSGLSIATFVSEADTGEFYGYINNSSSPATIDLTVEEMNETPDYFSIDAGKTIIDAINNIASSRSAKSVYHADGTLTVSYFDTHDILTTQLYNGIISISYKKGSPPIGKATIEGAYVQATAINEEALAKGGVHKRINAPNIFDEIECYRAAIRAIRQSKESSVKSSITISPAFELEPEDRITVTADNISEFAYTDHIINTVSHEFTGTNLITRLQTRKFYP